MKNWMLWAITSFVLCSSACEKNDICGDDGSSEGANLNLETTHTTSASNSNLTINIEFKGQMQMADGSCQDWDATKAEPYRLAAVRWLEVITGIQNYSNPHSIMMYVQVKELNGGLGAASPIMSSLSEINSNYFPTQGEMVISNYSYSQDFVNEYGSQAEADIEFNANILHEMGHIFGIGSLWDLSNNGGTIENDENGTLRDWVKEDNAAHKGAYYTRPQALAAYDELYNANLGFLPIGAGNGHLYDNVSAGDQKRVLDNGSEVPSMTQELMANGQKLGKVTVGLLDDLGWEVDYNNADDY